MRTSCLCQRGRVLSFEVKHISSIGIPAEISGTYVWCIWVLLCVLISFPGALYSIVKAVPGFLSSSKQWEWCLGHAVEVTTAILSTSCVPLVAKLLGDAFGLVGRAELLSVGKLTTALLLPCMATALCHEQCFGLWTWWWEPCLSKPLHGHQAMHMAELETLIVDLSDHGTLHHTNPHNI
eukprot:2954322-Amphidinium_carterae.1